MWLAIVVLRPRFLLIKRFSIAFRIEYYSATLLLEVFGAINCKNESKIVISFKEVFLRLYFILGFVGKR
jgi:hypothetical protein